jgi:hypothetical protein
LGQVIGNEVLFRLLGIEQFCSEYIVSRALEKQDEESMMLRMNRHTRGSAAALLRHDWILDLNATLKTLHGRQEETPIEHNTMRHGRPSRTYESILLGAAKLVVNVDV